MLGRPLAQKVRVGLRVRLAAGMGSACRYDCTLFWFALFCCLYRIWTGGRDICCSHSHSRCLVVKCFFSYTNNCIIACHNLCSCDDCWWECRSIVDCIYLLYYIMYTHVQHYSTVHHCPLISISYGFVCRTPHPMVGDVQQGCNLSVCLFVPCQ